MPSTCITTSLWARRSETKTIAAGQDALLGARHVRTTTAMSCSIYMMGLPGSSRRVDRTATRIEIVLFSGRSLEAKKALYSAIVANLSALGLRAEEIKIVLIEVPPDNWGLHGLHGGLPASEIDLGFRIDV